LGGFQAAAGFFVSGCLVIDHSFKQCGAQEAEVVAQPLATLSSFA